MKCQRPCRSESAYCDVGNHWIHYNCEKLSSNEIATVQNDNLNTHFCNLCKNNQTTKLIIPKRPSVIQNLAQIMLDEEQQTQICGQCDSSMNTTNTNIYDIFAITFHKRCIQLQNNTRKCYSCVAIDEHNLQADTITSVNDENTIQNCVTGKNIQASPATYPKIQYESNEQTSLK